MTLLNNVASNQTSAKMRVTDWANYICEVFANGAPTGTIKFKGSMQEDVDFTVASSATNRWIYLNMVDADTGSPTAGSTGITTAGTALTKIAEINGSNMLWIASELSGWVAGNFTVIVSAVNPTTGD